MENPYKIKLEKGEEEKYVRALRDAGLSATRFYSHIARIIWDKHVGKRFKNSFRKNKKKIEEGKNNE